MKVLVITYYWPPSGGAGVQRWLKLCKYLPACGVEPIVLTVDPEKASYPSLDESLAHEVTNIEVHRTDSFEPLRIYGKIVGKKNVPTAGFSNVDKGKWTTKLAARIRSTQFIPDPRKGWNKFALPKAKALIEAHGIKKVITTGPPHSSHLIGLALQQENDIEWTVDMRDPWTDIYYYKDLHHTATSAAKDKALELEVLTRADRVLCANTHLKDLLSTKSEQLDPSKFRVLTNGYDPDDIPKHVNPDSDRTWITYTGTMSTHYDPTVLFHAMNEAAHSDALGLRLVGTVSEDLLQNAKDLDVHLETIATVPHRESVHWLLRSSALLLVIPKVAHDASIVPGKLFEYIGARRPIICIGPTDGASAQLVQESGSGRTFSRSMVQELAGHLDKLAEKQLEVKEILRTEQYARPEQAKQLAQMLTQ